MTFEEWQDTVPANWYAIMPQCRDAYEAGRAAGIEDAAGVASARAADWHQYRDTWPARDEARAIAAEIRALKEQRNEKT